MCHCSYDAAYHVENTKATQRHPERKNSSSLHPCNWAEVTLGTRGFSRSVSGFCQGFAARVNDLCPGDEALRRSREKNRLWQPG